MKVADVLGKSKLFIVKVKSIKKNKFSLKKSKKYWFNFLNTFEFHINSLLIIKKKLMKTIRLRNIGIFMKPRSHKCAAAAMALRGFIKIPIENLSTFFFIIKGEFGTNSSMLIKFSLEESSRKKIESEIFFDFFMKINFF